MGEMFINACHNSKMKKNKKKSFFMFKFLLALFRLLCQNFLRSHNRIVSSLFGFIFYYILLELYWILFLF